MTRPFGIHAHCFGRLPVAELARQAGDAGFTSVQLALDKALSDLDCTAGRLSPGLGSYIAETFQRQGVRIAVLECGIDPIHPDPDVRRQGVKRFKEHLKFCRDFGCSVVATETGRLNTYCQEFPDDYEKKAWGILRHSLYELAEEAERWGVIVGIEPSIPFVIQRAEDMRRMLDEVVSTTLGVVLDPCSLLDTDNAGRQDEIVREAFDLLSDRVVAFHAKDALLRSDSLLTPTALGEGDVNVPLFLQLAQERKPYTDIILECLEGEQIGRSLEYGRQQWG
ncbi:sugar phosphate isomerase/epimerase family protein [Paenibacillus sp. HJGM_3]|uniref:sugar phosphate isomerase/epimerase family protein n=1 Tax=Paenibacillus sp. HJGM_3 TaxID=3379816 RepID=UPI00385F33DF